MASVYRSWQDGGKIVRGRQTAAARTKTPYDRPAPPAGSAPPQNPNWLTGVVYSTSRMIATGATKLFTFLFAPESSSSSSSSCTDSSPEDVVDDGTDDYDVPYDNGGSLNEKNGTTSELIECFRPEPQLTVGKSDIKRLIEKLVMQETFSREECDRLTKIIKSGVIDVSTMEEEKDEKLGGIPHRTVGDVTPELCSKAFMEAKKCLEEKVASSSKSEMDRGTDTLSSVALSQIRQCGALELETRNPIMLGRNAAPECGRKGAQKGSQATMGTPTRRRRGRPPRSSSQPTMATPTRRSQRQAEQSPTM